MITQKHIKTALLSALFLCFFAASSFAESSKTLVKDINFATSSKIEITLSAKTSFKSFTLKSPNRLVIDITKANLESKNLNPKNKPWFVSNFRSQENAEFLRLVFDLKKKMVITKTDFQLGSKKIIISISDSEKKSASKAESKKDDSIDSFISAKVEEFKVETTKVKNPDGSSKYVVRKIPKKLPIIVIDAGHGGKDPGTIGKFARTKEKNITLSYAKELAKQLKKTKRYKVYLTRSSDYFIPLRQRVSKARKVKADLFISLHANSAKDRSVSGFSIYTLSEKSSDKQAERLARKENRADIIAGVNFAGASQDIMKTLIDLSQRESKNSSSTFANVAIKSVKKSGIEILQNTHRFAGFAVLTAPDMASTLIEIGYLSNKSEERKLNSISYKRKVAYSLVKAINEYFSAQNK